MRKILAAVSAVSLFIASCADEKYPGFTETEPGVYYKLHYAGESGKKAGDEDFYEVRMQNKYGGKIFFDSDLQSVRGTMFLQSSASRYFSMLAEGDSATFLLPGGDLHLPGMPDTGMVEMNIKVVRILGADAVQQTESADADTDEHILIRRFLSRNKLNASPDSAGLYFLTVKPGSGNSPVKGRNVTIRYSGMMLSGQPFDKSPDNFSFIYGQEGQVLPGIERALSLMKTGQVAKIILPSPLAFGAGGSSTGIVPPHMPVVYELELVSAD
jgi:FKBP-type peptidyl-prolyl cis-trans isomerase